MTLPRGPVAPGEVTPFLDVVEPTHARHAGDVVRLLLGVAVLGAASLIVERTSLTTFERDVFRVFNDLPPVLSAPLLVVMQAGNALAAAAGAVSALLLRRRRLAFDLAVAGPLAWFAAKAVKRVMERPRPGGLLEGVLRSEESLGLGFVSGHTAVACALATVAAPYLPRGWRRAAWTVAWTVGIARMYAGAHLPLDIVGGAGLGWAIGASVHLALGAPHQVPGIREARLALARAGLVATDLGRIPGRPQGSFPFLAEVSGRRVFIKLLDPDPRDRDWLFRAARVFAVRDVRDEASLRDAAEQADHEAAMAMLARAAGVRVPAVERVERLGRQVWLVEQAIDGVSLARQDAQAITDRSLADVWGQVVLLHRAGIAHRDLVAGNVVIDGHGDAWLVDFAHATCAPRMSAFDNDIAELLVATAAVVGPRRAVEAAIAVVGVDAVAVAGAELRPLALTAEGRRTLRNHPRLTGDLRRELDRATEPARPTPPVEEDTTRVSRSAALVRLAVIAVAVATAVGHGASAAALELTTGSWRWAGLLVLTAVLALLVRGIPVMAASGRPLAVGRTAMASALADGRGFLRGVTAADDELARHLVRTGLDRNEAVATIRRCVLVRRLATAAGLAVAATASVAAGLEPELSARPVTTVALAATSVALPAVHAATRRRGSADGIRSPLTRGDSRWALLVAGSAIDILIRGLLLVVAAKVVGADAATATVLAVALVAQAAVDARALAVGAGSHELIVLAGLLVGAIPADQAVAMTVLSGLAGHWVPALVGTSTRSSLARRLVV